MAIDRLSPGLSHYVERIESGVPFSFLRYGDGEWFAVLGKQGHNCDGHEYFPMMGQELAASVYAIHDEHFLRAIGPQATRQVGAEIERWLLVNQVAVPWHSTEVWLEAGLAGELTQFIASLRKRRLLYVGPVHLRQFAADEFSAPLISVPDTNCYLAIDATERMIRRGISVVKPSVILFSAGMTSNILIHRLYPEFGQHITMLDLGSLFDPYVGVPSRSYARSGKYDFADLYRRNFT